MFRAGANNSYDDIVAKTTDENLTSENWELILNLCDKVQDEGEAGARNVVAAVLKRLAHRNPNVQLYALALAEALSKNCGEQVNREIASRSFTQGLERLITDRTSHDKVKRKALSLIAMWTTDFENDPQLGIMEECFENLKSKGYKFEEPSEPPPPQVDDEIRRREEEELQRVLEMSVHDKGGRGAWDPYNNAGSSSSAGPSSSSFTAGPSRSTEHIPAAGTSSRYSSTDYGYAKSTSGYVPARTPSPKPQSPVAASPVTALPSYAAASYAPSQIMSSSQTSLPITSVSRVRALHTFEGTEQGELTFEKGDIIKVVDRNYKDWWRGQLKGRTGIFPVNYVELLPDPTPEEIAKEAEQEAAIFAQAANIDKLLNMLRGLDPARDSLADNEEIQELYRTSMSLRPKIVKLIDKYSQKRAELVSMNETFVKARTMFDRMMEESLARHSALYDGRPPYQPVQSPGYGPPYGQNYPGFPQPNAAYNAATPTAGPQPYAAPGYPGQRPSYGQFPPQQAAGPYGTSQAPPDSAASSYSSYQPSSVGQSQPGSQPPAQGAPQPYSQQPSQPQVQSQQPQSQPQQAQVPPAHTTAQPQAQQNGYQEPTATPQAQAQAQPPSQAQGQPSVITQGPPYVFDPSATYPDPNAQAWAQYYAAGGDDPTGAVYFISVPGITDNQPQQTPPAQTQTHGQAQRQPERQGSLGGGSVDAQHVQQQQQPPHGSPTAERASFYQAYPGQSPGYQAQPGQQNGSAVSLGSAQGHTQQPRAIGSGGAPQQQQYPSQPAPGGSPTLANAPHGGASGSFYGAPQPQPSSPGAGAPPAAQQVYPPNPYPDPPVNTTTTASSPPAGVQPAQLANPNANVNPNPHVHTGYDMNTQYTQMHGQFAGMGMGEPRSPGTTAAPAVQTA